jgi:hypothetical protein
VQLNHVLDEAESLGGDDSKPIPKGNPLMEITEELDDADNVLCMYCFSARPSPIDPVNNPKASKLEDFDKAVDEITQVLNKHAIRDQNKNDDATSAPSTKSAAAAPSPKEAPRPSITESSELSEPTKPSQKRVVAELSDDDLLSEDDGEVDGSNQLSESEAQREMHRHLQQIGPVVATLDIEEDGFYSDDDFILEHDDDDMDDLEENEFGMSNIQDQMSDEYLKEMDALINKHSMKNLGPDQPMLNPEAPKSALAKTSKIDQAPSGLQNGKGAQDVKQHREKPKKGVRFAESLDIANPKTVLSDVVKPTQMEPTKINQAPLAESIIERSYDNTTGNAPRVPKPKLSKFKAAKLAKDNNGGPVATPPPPVPKAVSVVGDAMDSIKPEPTLKDEFIMYKKRMEAPDQQMDRAKWAAAQDNAGEVYEEPGTKISKFKAARLGISLEDMEDED